MTIEQLRAHRIKRAAALGFLHARSESPEIAAKFLAAAHLNSATLEAVRELRAAAATYGEPTAEILLSLAIEVRKSSLRQLQLLAGLTNIEP